MEMQFDFDSLLSLLAGHLYADKRVFLRELIQNAHDSIVRRQAVEPNAPPACITILAFPQELVLEIQDTGIGMDDRDIQTFLSTIGRSGTRLHKLEVGGLVGQFGIGLLSSFLVARRVEVRTRRYDASEGWLWVNEGRQKYELDSCPVEVPGTRVKVFLKGQEERGILYEEELRMLIKQYADMLPIPIYLNGCREPVNRQSMPWEQRGLNDDERQMACHVFLEETMPDHVLEVIPFAVEVEDCCASGVLYLTKTRTVGIAIERSVRVFLSRTFLTDQGADLLPKWSNFLNGVINVEGLTPTASRDNFFRNAAADCLREALGNVVIQHFVHLHEQNPERFRAIQRYHALGVKAACFYHQDLFAQLAPMLLWRTAGLSGHRHDSRAFTWKTLPEAVEALSPVPGVSSRIPYFTDAQSAIQYLALATANRLPVIDASYLFERELLQRYQQLPDVTVQFVHLEEEDTLSVFQSSVKPATVQFHDLVERLMQTLAPHHPGLQVDIRQFEPIDLPAILRVGEAQTATQRARALLEDPNITGELQDMAKELLVMSRRGATSQLVVNGASPLVQRLAHYGVGGGPHFSTLLQWLYHSALLHHGDAGSTRDHLQELGAYLNQLLDLAIRMGEMQVEGQARERILREARRLDVSESGKPGHRVVCVVTSPFFQQKAVCGVLTEWIEDRWECEVIHHPLADTTVPLDIQVPFHDLTRVDLLILGGPLWDTSMGYLLGRVHGQFPTCPVYVLLPVGMNPPPPGVPIVYQGVVLEYGSSGDDGAATRLLTELEAMPGVQGLLKDPTRNQFLSARRLADLTRLPLPVSIFRALAKNFPTPTHWHHVSVEAVKPLLHEFEDFAAPLCQRMTDQFPVSVSGRGSA